MSYDFPSGKVSLFFPKKLQVYCEMVWCGTQSALLIGGLLELDFCCGTQT